MQDTDSLESTKALLDNVYAAQAVASGVLEVLIRSHPAPEALRLAWDQHFSQLTSVLALQAAGNPPGWIQSGGGVLTFLHMWNRIIAGATPSPETSEYQ